MEGNKRKSYGLDIIPGTSSKLQKSSQSTAENDNYNQPISNSEPATVLTKMPCPLSIKLQDEISTSENVCVYLVSNKVSDELNFFSSLEVSK